MAARDAPRLDRPVEGSLPRLAGRPQSDHAGASDMVGTEEAGGPFQRRPMAGYDRRGWHHPKGPVVGPVILGDFGQAPSLGEVVVEGGDIGQGGGLVSARPDRPAMPLRPFQRGDKRLANFLWCPSPRLGAMPCFRPAPGRCAGGAYRAGAWLSSPSWGGCMAGGQGRRRAHPPEGGKVSRCRPRVPQAAPSAGRPIPSSSVRPASAARSRRDPRSRRGRPHGSGAEGRG